MRLLTVGMLVLAVGGCASQGGLRNHGDLARQARHKARLTQAGAKGLSSHRRVLKTALLHYYKNWAGTPYRWGGQSKKGVDCSSFVRHTIRAVESYELPRTTRQQVKVGVQVPRSDLQVGDLVFFKTGPRTHHVGIYIGNGRFIDSSSSDGVTISRLGNTYWRRHYWQSRRIRATDGRMM